MNKMINARIENTAPEEPEKVSRNFKIFEYK
jgi:hypothetical protein